MKVRYLKNKFSPDREVMKIANGNKISVYVNGVEGMCPSISVYPGYYSPMDDDFYEPCTKEHFNMVFDKAVESIKGLR